jgi:hypothetical protein
MMNVEMMNNYAGRLIGLVTPTPLRHRLLRLVRFVIRFVFVSSLHARRPMVPRRFLWFLSGLGRREWRKVGPYPFGLIFVGETIVHQMPLRHAQVAIGATHLGIKLVILAIGRGADCHAGLAIRSGDRGVTWDVPATFLAAFAKGHHHRFLPPPL